jgi:hypothetical protein
MQPAPQLLLNIVQLCRHALADHPAVHREITRLEVLPIEVSETW